MEKEDLEGSLWPGEGAETLVEEGGLWPESWITRGYRREIRI